MTGILSQITRRENRSLCLQMSYETRANSQMTVLHGIKIMKLTYISLSVLSVPLLLYEILEEVRYLFHRQCQLLDNFRSRQTLSVGATQASSQIRRVPPVFILFSTVADQIWKSLLMNVERVNVVRASTGKSVNAILFLFQRIHSKFHRRGLHFCT